MEKIISIDEISEGEKWNSYEGYLIKTDKQEIKLLIEGGQSCCETWGYFLSEDDISYFVGSDLIDVTLTDVSLNTIKFMNELEKNEISYDTPFKQPYIYYGDIMFVNINTTNGLLQFCAYNEHNGYYGHTAKVISTQLTHEKCL